MAEYPLKTLLGLRRREEEVASQAGTKAQDARRLAESEATRLTEAVRALEERLVAARKDDNPGALPTRSASDVTAAVRFEARLRDELARATALCEAHRRGPLARACAREDDARKEVMDRRRAREALETHEEQFRQTQRQETDRRADEDNDEHARLARHDRLPRGR